MSEQIKMDLGKFLKVAGITKGISVTKVAENANIARSSFSTIMTNGSCTTNTLQRLIEAMDEPFVILFNGVEYQITDKK